MRRSWNKMASDRAETFWLLGCVLENRCGPVWLALARGTLRLNRPPPSVFRRRSLFSGDGRFPNTGKSPAEARDTVLTDCKCSWNVTFYRSSFLFASFHFLHSSPHHVNHSGSPSACRQANCSSGELTRTEPGKVLPRILSGFHFILPPAWACLSLQQRRFSLQSEHKISLRLLLFWWSFWSCLAIGTSGGVKEASWQPSDPIKSWVQVCAIRSMSSQKLSNITNSSQYSVFWMCFHCICWITLVGKKNLPSERA